MYLCTVFEFHSYTNLIMKHSFCISLLLGAINLTLVSCFGDEPANAECDIEQAWIHVDNPRSVFYNAYDTLKTVTSIEKEITFETKGEAIHSAPIFFKTTPGATVYVVEKNGIETAFTNGNVLDFSGAQVITFRVHSEDHHYHRDYSVQVTPRPEMPVNPTFNFDDNFELTTIKDGDQYPFYTWTETEAKIKWWASGNAGFRLTGTDAKPEDFPTCPELGTGVDGKNCLKLETRSTGSLGPMVKMRIAAGNLFSGTFDTESAMKRPLSATHFGQPYAHKPSCLKGFYKFSPGDKLQDRAGNEISGKVDSPDFYCVVYRNTDADGNPIQLDGSTVLSSPAIVGIGRISQEDIVIRSEWTAFSLPITYSKIITEEDVFDYKYNTAVVFSSSIRGHEFIGAPGSTLWIDNVKLECEY